MKIIAFALLLAFPTAALADDVTPVLKDKPAPFTGLLVIEERFVKMLDAELAVEELSGRLKIEQRYAENLEKMYTKKLEEATAPPAWYDSPTFRMGFGFTLGVVVAVLAVYGGARLAEAGNSGR